MICQPVRKNNNPKIPTIIDRCVSVWNLVMKDTKYVIVPATRIGSLTHDGFAGKRRNFPRFCHTIYKDIGITKNPRE